MIAWRQSNWSNNESKLGFVQDSGFSVWSTDTCHCHLVVVPSGVLKAGFGGFKPLPKFRRPSKIVPNSTRLWKLLQIAEFRMPVPQDVWKKGSKILKLPRFTIVFTLAVANKLVVIINCLKVPKIEKILLYEMKFLVPNYSCLQNPWLGGCCPLDPRSLCPQSSTEFVEPPLSKIPGYATGSSWCFEAITFLWNVRNCFSRRTEDHNH